MKYLQKVLLILFTLTLTAITGSASAEVTYFHHDAQGSTIAATSETGAVLWRESYEPYGERLDKAVSTNDHATYYTGKPHDDRTGLTYFGARHYDPVVGRFMGIDPVGVDPGDVHSFNRYAYANNNPYKYVDPDGNLPFLIPVVIFIAKEVAAEAFERTTGLPALFSVKGVVKAAGKKLGSSSGKRFLKGGGDGGSSNASGIVYKRTNPKTGEIYYGQAKSSDRFNARQGEHDRALGEKHNYEIVGRAKPGIDLDIAEHNAIQRATGGVRAKDSPLVANKKDPVGRARRKKHNLPEPRRNK
ncbi:MAG: hypothetical protein MI756_07850 [Chromatiales bacterium]|nr:hypothetical protein [Chromatiales bacterium]